MQNQQIELFQLLGLAVYIPLKDEDSTKKRRNRIKKTPFKVLQGIFQLVQNNLNKKRTEHYPSKELIAEVSGCTRRQVTEFITSEVSKEFVDVFREYDPVTKKFKANRYMLKDWVFDAFRLFWRSGMMKHYQTNWDWWISDFKNRIYNWLIPLLDKGMNFKEIHASVMNKLSTKKSLKGAAANPLKGADIKPTGLHKDYVTRTNGISEPPQVPILQEMTFICNTMVNRFHVKEGDMNRILRYYTPVDVKTGYRIHSEWVNNGFKPKSPAATFVAAIQKGMKDGNFKL